MGLLETASGQSVWRGMDYYQNHKVISWQKTGDFTYDGTVSGSNGEVYMVHVDKKHPKRSTCNCPFADGRPVVCKHMIAVYFTAEPQAAESFLRQVELYEQEEEERQEQHLADLRLYVNSLSKALLREHLYNALLELDYIKENRW